MTDAVTISLIAAISSTVGTVVSLINNLIARRNSEKIATLEINTNSIHDELIASTAKASKAEGKLEGKAEQKQEQKDETKVIKLPHP